MKSGRAVYMFPVFLWSWGSFVVSGFATERVDTFILVLGGVFIALGLADRAWMRRSYGSSP